MDGHYVVYDFDSLSVADLREILKHLFSELDLTLYQAVEPADGCYKFQVRKEV